MKLTRILAGLFFMAISFSAAQTNAVSDLFADFTFEGQTSNLSATLNSEAHRLLFKAFEVAELQGIFDTSGPFTVFAPSDNAFSRFTKEELTALFQQENRQKLKAMLTYHMVAGSLTASKILSALCRGNGNASFTTVQGNKIFATMEGTDILLKDESGNQAKITSADTGYGNGVIHKIDNIILPSGI